ncbi:hypothetical protein FRC11_000501, partial [Ceratobasidium sp. 423]
PHGGPKVFTGDDPQIPAIDERSKSHQDERKVPSLCCFWPSVICVEKKSKVYRGDFITEFDPAGTELGKEARIWRTYVKQSDKWDAELVDGWN